MKLVKTMMISASLLASLSYAQTKVNPEPVVKTINAESLVAALNNIKYWGVMRYKGEHYEYDTQQEQYNDVDYSIFLNGNMAENLEWGLHIGSRSGSQAFDRNPATDGNKNVKMNIDMLQFHATYTNEAFKLQAGQMTLKTPLTDNSPINPETAVGAIGSYTTDNMRFQVGYFQDLEFAQHYNNEIAELSTAAVYTLGLVLNYDAFNFQGWAIRAEGVYDQLLFAEVGIKDPSYALKLQGVNSTLNDDFGGETGTYYAGEAKGNYQNISARIGFSVNDEDQGLYSLDGKDSSGLIEIGGEMKSTLQNVADADSIFGDVTATMGKFSAKVGYAVASIGSEDLTEYYGHIGYNYNPKLLTKIYVSDIDSDNDKNDAQYIKLEALYFF